MVHVLGAEKEFFLIRGAQAKGPQGGRAGGILSIRGPEVPLGALGVGTLHVQSPTAHARALPSIGTSVQVPSQLSG